MAKIPENPAGHPGPHWPSVKKSVDRIRRRAIISLVNCPCIETIWNDEMMR